MQDDKFGTRDELCAHTVNESYAVQRSRQDLSIVKQSCQRDNIFLCILDLGLKNLNLYQRRVVLLRVGHTGNDTSERDLLLRYVYTVCDCLTDLHARTGIGILETLGIDTHKENITLRTETVRSVIDGQFFLYRFRWINRRSTGLLSISITFVQHRFTLCGTAITTIVTTLCRVELDVTSSVTDIPRCRDVLTRRRYCSSQTTHVKLCCQCGTRFRGHTTIPILGFLQGLG